MHHAVAAVLPADVVNHFAAPGIGEVDVEIRQADPLGVREALEQQTVLQRLDVGYAQRGGDYGAGARTTARPDGDALVLGPGDEVSDDQAVIGEAHGDDHAELELHPAQLEIGRAHV